MSVPYSPLRYPGGKATLSGLLSDCIRCNHLQDRVYVEPYAGGAGAGLTLLFGEYVNRLLINDLDQCIYSFWKSVLTRTSHMLDLLCTVPLTMREWDRQRSIYSYPHRYTVVQVGFATLYLNRCNRSGILRNGGPIGGRKQTGRWTMEARFNRQELSQRIERISLFRDRIQVTCKDALTFMREDILATDVAPQSLVFLDPPYYSKGPSLYLNHYDHDDHQRFATFIQSQVGLCWVMTYDNVPAIRDMYSKMHIREFKLHYSAHSAKTGTELLIHPPWVDIPPLPDKFVA